MCKKQVELESLVDHNHYIWVRRLADLPCACGTYYLLYTFYPRSNSLWRLLLAAMRFQWVYSLESSLCIIYSPEISLVYYILYFLSDWITTLIPIYLCFDLNTCVYSNSRWYIIRHYLACLLAFLGPKVP